MFEYKVITDSDSRFTGKFDSAVLEQHLNSHAQDGWRVVGSLLAASVWKSAKSEIVVILERPAAD